MGAARGPGGDIVASAIGARTVRIATSTRRVETGVSALPPLLLLSTGLVPAVRVSSAVAGFSFSAAGDAGSWSGFDSSREALGRSGSNFFLAMGDLSYGGSSEEHWCRELKQSFPDAEILAGN